MGTQYIDSETTGICATRKGRTWSARATGRTVDNVRVIGKGASSDFDTAVRYALLDLREKIAGPGGAS